MNPNIWVYMIWWLLHCGLATTLKQFQWYWSALAFYLLVVSIYCLLCHLFRAPFCACKVNKWFYDLLGSNSISEPDFSSWKYFSGLEGGDAGNFYLTNNDMCHMQIYPESSTYIKKFHNQSRQAFYPVLLKA